MNGAAEYHRFPTPEQRAAFCEAYLRECGAPHDADAVSALVAEAQKFVLANHWYVHETYM
jgi:hypothetical protein